MRIENPNRNIKTNNRLALSESMKEDYEIRMCNLELETNMI